MKSLTKIISSLELFYLMILPFMGYIATGIYNEGYFLMWILGIGLLFVYQILIFGIWNEKKNNYSVIFLLGSIFITAFNYSSSENAFWAFWLEKSFLELGTIGLVFLTLFTTEARKEFGWGFIIFLLAIMTGGFWEMGKAWINNNHYFNNNLYLSVNLIISFVFDFIWLYSFLFKVNKGEIILKDIDNNRFVMIIIIMELIIWIFCIPLLLGMLGYIS